MFWNYAANLQENTHAEVWFQESCKAAPAKQLYWNFTSAWVFSCKFAAYFRIPFIKNTSGQLFLNIECSTLVLISKNNCFIPNYKYRKLNLLLIMQPRIISKVLEGNDDTAYFELDLVCRTCEIGTSTYFILYGFECGLVTRIKNLLYHSSMVLL